MSGISVMKTSYIFTIFNIFIQHLFTLNFVLQDRASNCLMDRKNMNIVLKPVMCFPLCPPVPAHDWADGYLNIGGPGHWSSWAGHHMHEKISSIKDISSFLIVTLTIQLIDLCHGSLILKPLKIRQSS